MYWPFVQVSFQTTEVLIRGFGLYGALTDVSSLLQLTNFSLIPIRWRSNTLDSVVFCVGLLPLFFSTGR